MTGAFGLWSFKTAQLRHEARRDAERDASTRKARHKADTIRDLEERVNKLMLVTMAMWSFLKEKDDLTEEQLVERVRDIDLRDGQLDGKVQKQVARCSQCDRVMSQRHTRCIYCGAAKLSTTAFDDVL